MENAIRSDLRRAVAVVRITFTAGNDTLECCREALRIANLWDVSVEWNMNSIEMFATRSMNTETLDAEYHKRLTEACDKAYAEGRMYP